MRALPQQTVTRLESLGLKLRTTSTASGPQLADCFGGQSDRNRSYRAELLNAAGTIAYSATGDTEDDAVTAVIALL